MSGHRIARIAVFAALVAVFGLTPGVTIVGSVPVTAQSLAVMLAGLMLAPLDAFLALMLFLVLLLMGLPLMPNGFGGLKVLSSARGGFALGFPVAALTVSLIATGLRRRRPLSNGNGLLAANTVAAVLGGVGVLYLFAVPVGAALGDLPVRTFAKTMTTFIPWDLLKAAVAAVVAASAFRAAPFLRPDPSFAPNR